MNHYYRNRNHLQKRSDLHICQLFRFWTPHICIFAKYMLKWKLMQSVKTKTTKTIMFSGPDDCITPTPPPCLLIQALNQSNNIQPWYGEKNPNQQNMYLKPRPTGPMLFDQHLHEIDQLGRCSTMISIGFKGNGISFWK